MPKADEIGIDAARILSQIESCDEVVFLWRESRNVSHWRVYYDSQWLRVIFNKRKRKVEVRHAEQDKVQV